MSASEAVAQLLTVLLMLTLVSLAYSVSAVFVRERFGRPGLVRLMIAAAMLLLAGAAYNLWTNFQAAGAAENLTLAVLGLIALGVCFPLAGTTWIVSRQRLGVRGAAWIGQSLGGMLAFWGSLFLLLLPALVLDVIRFF